MWKSLRCQLAKKPACTTGLVCLHFEPLTGGWFTRYACNPGLNMSPANPGALQEGTGLDRTAHEPVTPNTIRHLKAHEHALSHE